MECSPRVCPKCHCYAHVLNLILAGRFGEVSSICLYFTGGTVFFSTSKVHVVFKDKKSYQHILTNDQSNFNNYMYLTLVMFAAFVIHMTLFSYN